MQIEQAKEITIKFLSTLNESQKRWFLGREALLLGHGGIKKMCDLTGVTKPTVIRGIKELKSELYKEISEQDRIRQKGGGRKRIEEKEPEVLRLIEAIMKETTLGDPMSLLKWTGKSTYQISEQLRKHGFEVSADTVGRRLKEMDYSLQANIKSIEGDSHVDRDSQFRYINELAKRYIKDNNPVISVDTKKKERIGLFKNAGRKWRPKGAPIEVNTYDFENMSEGTAIPYGAYDIDKNHGVVNVGISHNTAEFAVESIKQWWRLFGSKQYPDSDKLLICADGGGSNGSRNRAWKYFLQRLVNEIKLSITVCHYPPGTSKWNKIEHRMFSFISMNWRGEPLVSYETVVNMISSTTTVNGLKIKAVLDSKIYKTGLKITDDQMRKLTIKYHKRNSQWNYTITPTR
jgi:hypothetical protein